MTTIPSVSPSRHPSVPPSRRPYAELSGLARLVLYLESIPDPADDKPEPSAVVAQKRTDLRDRMGRIVAIDRSDTVAQARAKRQPKRAPALTAIP